MMTWEKPASPAMTERGMRVALIFALAAERLTAFYEHAQWMTEAQGASLAADGSRIVSSTSAITRVEG